METAKRKARSNNLQPSLTNFLSEEYEFLILIEEKKRVYVHSILYIFKFQNEKIFEFVLNLYIKQVNEMINEVENLDLKEESYRPKLKSAEKKFDAEKRNLSKEINWRQFKSGIGSS